MFTSKMAMQSLWQADAKKKHKQNKALIDKLSATILLQSYLAQTQV
jgi:putative Holliday junction resolvase